MIDTRTVRLLVLAGAAFVYVTAETLPIGLLPEMSSGLNVSESSIGFLLTFYAYGVALMTMPLIKFVSTWPRRRIVVISVAALAISQLLAACALNYPMLVVARMLCAATHGVFWAVVAQVAASLAAPGKQGKAIATVYAGTSLALVAGNPISAALGQWLGWRPATVAVGLVSAAIAVALHLILPNVPVTAVPTENKARILDRRLVLICAATLFAALGQFAAYTYFALMVQRAIGDAAATLSIMLLVYGIFGVAGIWIIGRTFDRWPKISTLATLSTVAAALGLFAIALAAEPGTLAWLAIVATAMWGLAFTMVPVCLQTTVLRSAPANPDKASAMYVVTFQVAIATGALIGGGIIDVSSLTVLSATAMVMAAIAVVIVAISRAPLNIEHRDIEHRDIEHRAAGKADIDDVVTDVSRPAFSQD